MDTRPPETPASLCRNLTQQLFLVLAAEPDVPQIPVPRRWLADWYLTLLHAIELLEQP